MKWRPSTMQVMHIPPKRRSRCSIISIKSSSLLSLHAASWKVRLFWRLAPCSRRIPKMAGLASRAAVWSTAPESGIPGVTVFLGWIWVGAKVGVCTLGFTLCLGQSNNAGWVVFFNNAPIYKQLKSVVSKPLSIGWRTRWINNKKGIEHTSREPHNLLSFDEYPIHTQVRP